MQFDREEIRRRYENFIEDAYNTDMIDKYGRQEAYDYIENDVDMIISELPLLVDADDLDMVLLSHISEY